MKYCEETIAVNKENFEQLEKMAKDLSFKFFSVSTMLDDLNRLLIKITKDKEKEEFMEELIEAALRVFCENYEDPDDDYEEFCMAEDEEKPDW